MKTTDKYAARMRHNGTPFSQNQRGPHNEVATASPRFPRELVLMRIHQILKSARDIISK